MIKVVCIIVIGLLLPAGSGSLYAQEPDLVPGRQASLLAGVCKVDITPPMSIPLGGYANRTGDATGIRDPLHAEVIVFDDGKTRAAIVTLDLIQVKNREGRQICRAIEKETGIEEGHVIINASHTHGSPWLETDSCYSSEVADKVAGAVRVAAETLQPVSIGCGEGKVNFNVNRRVITGEGKCITGLNPDGITDHRVKVLRIDEHLQQDATSPLAVIFHVVCHPNVFRGQNTKITADFPGEAKKFVERNFGSSTKAFFLQGCCGDVRANLPLEGKSPQESSFGRSGSETDMRWCGWSTGAEVVKVTASLGVREEVKQRRGNFIIRSASQVLKISGEEKTEDVEWPRWNVVDGKADIPVKIIAIGNICFVALPGEPVVEYGFKVEEIVKKIGFTHVFVMGYSDGDAGYIPTREMFSQGGYEVKESALLQVCEEEILTGVTQLVHSLNNH